MQTIEPGSCPAWGFSATAALTPLALKELSNTCPYGWIVETRYGAGGITAGFVGGAKGRKRYAYQHGLTVGENHVAAAAAFLQGLSSANGSHAYQLVAKASTDKGFVFSFR